MDKRQPCHPASNNRRLPSRLSPWGWHWGWLICTLLLLGSPMRTDALYAQEREAGGTVPNGTIPDESNAGAVRLYLPMIASQASGTNPTPSPTPAFTSIPIEGPPTDRPAADHPDLNLAIRSYLNAAGELTLVDNDGPTDQNAPQFNGIFQPARLPAFIAVYQIYDWDWACGEDGCQGEPLTAPPVSLLALETTPGEALHLPTRGPQIYAGGYKAMVLYADTNRITFAYTRRDTAAIGYIVHMEDLLVDPALLALYQETDHAGRSELPALHANEPFATALGTTIKVAIRDTGTFMEPRSRKDWWKAY